MEGHVETSLTVVQRDARLTLVVREFPVRENEGERKRHKLQVALKTLFLHVFTFNFCANKISYC